MEVLGPRLNEDIILFLLQYTPIKFRLRFSLVDKYWYHKAVDCESCIASVPSSHALRLSRLRPRKVAIGLPYKDSDKLDQIINALCLILQNATSVEITAPKEEDNFDADGYDTICRALNNVTDIVFRSPILPEVTSFEHFPHLTKLQCFLEEEDMQEVIVNCPKLELLHIFINTEQLGSLFDFVEKLKPLKHLKELILDDPIRELHLFELLTDKWEPDSAQLMKALEKLKAVSPPALHVSRIFIASQSDTVMYAACESLPLLLLPYVPEIALQSFLENDLDANATCFYKSAPPLVTATLAPRSSDVAPRRSLAACADIMFERGVNIFRIPDRSYPAKPILHELVILQSSEALAHIINHVVTRYPTRLVELLLDSSGFTIFHDLNIFPAGTVEGVQRIIQAISLLPVDMATLMNDRNNSHEISGVANFVRNVCEVIPRVKRPQKALRVTVAILKQLRAAGADLTLPDREGLTILTRLISLPNSNEDLVLSLFESDAEIEASLTLIPADWANSFLHDKPVPSEEGRFWTVWKTAVARSSHSGRQAAFKKAVASSAAEKFVMSLVDHVVECGYDPKSLIDGKKPWIELSRRKFPQNLLTLADKFDWDLGWFDQRGISIICFTTNHRADEFDEKYAILVAELLKRIRSKPLDELRLYASSGVSAFAGNLSYWMLSQDHKTVDLFTTSLKNMVLPIWADFLELGDAALESPRVCWLITEQLLFAGVANSIGQDLAAETLQKLGSHVDKENSLGNSSVLVTAATFCCLASTEAEIEWFCRAFSILFSESWKEHRFTTRSTHVHTNDVNILEILHILVSNRWSDLRIPVVKLVIDYLDTELSSLSSEGIQMLLLSRNFGYLNEELVAHFCSKKILDENPFLEARLLCTFVQDPSKFPIAHLILDKRPKIFESTSTAADLVLRCFCHSLDAVVTSKSFSEAENCVTLLGRIVKLGAKTYTPLADDYLRQYPHDAIPEVVELFQQTYLKPDSAPKKKRSKVQKT